MKFYTLIKFSAIAVVLSLSVVGCRKGLDRTTPLPKRGEAAVGPEQPAGPIGDTGNRVAETTAPTPIPVPVQDPNKSIPLNAALSTWVPSADQPFPAYTVYFDYDKSTIKPGEVSKVEHVASAMKSMAGKALRIEGHCDERGTEEYNRSLGERRALAVRESLVRAGVDAGQIDTVSLGEDRPADPGHNEAAWSKNRRGVFIVIEPPSPGTSK
jgi:peptidoglycan-associated lipoprotein